MATHPAMLPSPADLSPFEVGRIIDTALTEDLASGDVTTRAVVPAGAIAKGAFRARGPLVIAGLGVAAAVFARLDPRIEVLVLHPDGGRVSAPTDLARVTGPAHAVLTGERVALNLLQRMSGV